MGISFKVSKIGIKYKPKHPILPESTLFPDDDYPVNSKGNEDDAVRLTGSSMSSGKDHSSEDVEVSFSLNLYQDGYSIVKALENYNEHHAAFQDGSKLLHPYDRASESFFDAIESGQLPCGILDDISCKFVEGAVMCEVRDYRNCVPQPGSNLSSQNESATITKVSLKMSLENVVKDIPLMADDSWTYGDLMEVESRIVNALQPKLCLDPMPRLDRLCRNPAPMKINLGIAGMWRKRPRQIPQVTVTSNNCSNGKIVFIDRAPESPSYGDIMSQNGQENVLVQGSANQRTMQHQGHAFPQGVLPAGQDMPVSYTDEQSVQYSNFNKKPRIGSGGPDGIQNPQVGSFQGSDVQWGNPMGQQHPNAQGPQYGNSDVMKQENDQNMVKSDMQVMGDQRFQHQSMRPAFQQPGWNLGQQNEREPKKKSNQSPRFSGSAVAQSPLSVRSGEMSGGSMGPHYGVVSSGVPLGQLQNVQVAGRPSSGTPFANEPMQHQHQPQITGSKRKSNSLPKTPVISGVGSSASVNNMGCPMNASSPSITTPQLTEQAMLERLRKIGMVATRNHLNRRKNKIDEVFRNPRTFSSQELQGRLASVSNNDYADDSKELSKSLVGGHMNVCKIRVVTVRPGMQGNNLPLPVRTRMIFSEKPNDGTVAMHYGDLDDGDYLNSEDHLPTLPNTHWADLLADQFCALLLREGHLVDEVVQPRPPRITAPSNGQPNNSTVDTQQHSDSFPGQTTESKPAISNTSLNSTVNVLPNSGMHPPGNSQTPHMSQGHMPGIPRPQQMDPQQQPSLQNPSSLMQQLPPQYQRSSLMSPNNSMPQLNAFGQSSNLPMGNLMDNKSSVQMLQQPGQQSQHVNMQRRMMMGLGTAIGNNMGLGGLSNVMGIGGAKGVGPLSNMAQNPLAISQANAISQHLRAGGALNQQARLKLMHNRGMLGGAHTQSGITNIPGASRQLQPGQPGSTGLSMLGQSLNRGNIGQVQRTAMGQMGIPNLMPGMSGPFTPQQLQQLQILRHNQQQQQLQQQQLQQQQQQQQQQPRQHVLPQQEATSPLQGVLSPQQASSPSTMGIPQQMNQQASPQQMSQRAPMSPPLSSGPVHPMSAGNPDVCPASPALSSQTLGSVGSITNSPMDLQAVNKSNSVTNT